MKKLLLILLIMMYLFFPVVSKALVTNSFYNNINIYFFYEGKCKECDEGKKWLDNKLKENNRVKVEYIKINNNKDLNNDVRKALNIKKDKTPLIVIGSNYFIGFNNNIKNDLENAIKSYEDEEDFCDIVSRIKNNESTKECFKQNEGIYKKSNISNIFYILLGAIICIILAISIVLIRKKRD